MPAERIGGVAVRTLGCKVNRTESEALAEALIARGVPVSAVRDGADVVVINTCTVTGEADAKARKEVRRALAAPGGPDVVVTGCLAAVDADGLRALGRRVTVEPDRAALAGTVASLFAARRRSGPPAVVPRGPKQRPPEVFRTRVMVKVQDGCDRRCAYCIVPDARGNPVSVPVAEVLARVDALARAGTAEVVLTGVNIGRYRDGATGLGELVRAIGARGVPRIRISSIEPLDVTDDLLDVLASVSGVMPHLHVPLQSGCDRTLEAMGRGYSAPEYRDAVRRARAALPGLAVTTDVIAGFPGETDRDFEESLAFVEACGFAGLHVFRYSRRRGTPAYAMPGQVPAPVASARARALRDAGARLATSYGESRVGGTAEVLVESLTGRGAVGTSEDHLRVTVPDCDAASGAIVRVRLISKDADGGLTGRPLSRG